MMSFPNSDHDADSDLFTLDPKDEAVSYFVALVGEQLQEAFLCRKKQEGLTQQQLATTIGVDRSRIHRCLSGYSNLTIESVAELAWALKGKPEFRIVLDTPADHTCNYTNFDHGVKIIANEGVTVLQTDRSHATGSAVSKYKVHQSV